ncbi:MAG: response regulator, partial [Myxococcota bacterium]
MAEATASGVRRNRILVVDDEEGMRHMLSVMLSRHGYDVETAENGIAALESLRSGAIDIVLADIKMPELDGLGLLEKITEAKFPVTVIMMSAFADIETAIVALKSGATDYVSKPFKADEVLLKIRMAQERVAL